MITPVAGTARCFGYDAMGNITSDFPADAKTAERLQATSFAKA
jgi:hypothetical protein